MAKKSRTSSKRRTLKKSPPKRRSPKRKSPKKTSKRKSPKKTSKRKTSGRVKKSITNACSLRKKSECGGDPNCHYVNKRGCMRRRGAATKGVSYEGPVMPVGM